MFVDEIKRKVLSEPEKVIIGAKRTIKYLKLGKIEKVFVAKNAPEDIVKDIEYYSKLVGAEVVKLDISNEELGAVLKKPIKVAVLSFLKK